MRRKREQDGMVRVELKYCEHCGGLWVREKGAGVVYCDKCREKVADLPGPKKGSGRINLPVAPMTVAERFNYDCDEENGDLEAVGGVAWAI